MHLRYVFLDGPMMLSLLLDSTVLVLVSLLL